MPFRVGQKVYYFNQGTNRWKKGVITAIGKHKGMKAYDVKVRNTHRGRSFTEEVWGWEDQISAKKPKQMPFMTRKIREMRKASKRKKTKKKR